jgi:hypothetical protein
MGVRPLFGTEAIHAEAFHFAGRQNLPAFVECQRSRRPIAHTV